MAAVLGPTARGLTIDTQFVAPGNEIPGIGTAAGPSPNTTGGGDLESIVRAAADVWEGLVLDDHALTLHFGWFPTSPISSSAYHQGVSIDGSPLRQTEGSLAFNSEAASFPFFMDPTPGSNEEYRFGRQEFGDFGGGLVELRTEYESTSADATGSSDLYSVALHEIGHSLGLVGWSFFNDETADGDIDVTIAPYSGTEIPMSASHIDVIGPLMSSSGRPLGTRRDVTQFDRLAVCQVSQFSQCDLSVSPVVIAGDFNTDAMADGADFLAWQRGDSPNRLSPADLENWKATFGATAAGPSLQYAAVPEPTANALAAIGLAAILLMRPASGRSCE